MSLPSDSSINHDYFDDLENEFTINFSSDNSSQSLNLNLRPPETYRGIIAGNSSEVNSPYFIISRQKEQNEQEKKRRGKQVELNAKRSKKEMHSSISEDNILTKIQIHFLNFIIFFLNDCVYNYYKNRKIKFIKFAHEIKAKVSSKYLNKMKNSTIYDLLTEIEISSKFTRHNKNNNEKNAKILNKIPWFKKIFELKFLDLFQYYHNENKQLNKIFLFEREITLTKDTKSYYFLLEKNMTIKKEIIEITKYNYLSKINSIESNENSLEYSDRENGNINYYEEIFQW